jgi:hypothetical protein
MAVLSALVAPGPRQEPRWRTVLLTAFLIALLGFGVLNALWFLGDCDPRLRGLWSFRSATLGDGLLLPILAASLLVILHSLDATPREAKFALIAFAVGGCLFLSVVAIWVVDTDHELNWTMPAPHSLNGAGVYHTAFGSLLAGSLAALGVLAFRRTLLNPATSSEPRVVKGWLMATTCLLAFGAAAAIDPLSADSLILEPFILQPAGLGALLFVAGMLVLVFRPEAAGRRWRIIMLPLIAGPAIALSSWTPSALFDLPQGFILPLVAMTVAVGFHFTLNRLDYWFIELLGGLLLATFVLATGLERLADSLLRGTLWLLISWLLLSALFLRRIEGRHSLKENLPFLPASAYVFYVLALTVVVSSHDISDAVLVTSMLLPLTLLRITNVAATRYAAMIEDELALGDRYDREGKLPDRCVNLEESYWANWLAILGFAIALISAFFNLLDVRDVFRSLQFGLANTQPFALLDGFFVLVGRWQS